MQNTDLCIYYWLLPIHLVAISRIIMFIIMLNKLSISIYVHIYNFGGDVVNKTGLRI